MTSVDTDSEVEDHESSPVENVSSPSESDTAKTSIVPNSSNTNSATINGKVSTNEDESKMILKLFFSLLYDQIFLICLQKSVDFLKNV